MRPKSILLFVMAASASSALAEAQNLRRIDVEASAIYERTVSIAPGSAVDLELTNVSPGTEPVMYLLRRSGTGYTQVARSPFALTPAGRIQYTNSSLERTHLLVVHADVSSPAGTATLNVNGQRTEPPIPIGGTTMPASDFSRIAGDRMHTVEIPWGSRRPVVLVLRGRGTTLFDVVDDGGVGGGVSFTPSGLDVRYVFGTLHGHDRRGTRVAPRAGVTRVVVNDAADADGDGLGDRTELEFGTCPSSTGCAAFNPADTDRDGLLDGEEVLGVAASTPSAHLRFPAWGADPLHKDVFVEVDYEARLGSNPFADRQAAGTLDSWIADITGPFLVGPAAELDNPDGVDGVAIHLDLGVDPINPLHEVTYGDYSSSSRVVPYGFTIEIDSMLAGGVELTVDGTLNVLRVYEYFREDAAVALAAEINALNIGLVATAFSDEDTSEVAIRPVNPANVVEMSAEVVAGTWGSITGWHDRRGRRRKRRFDPTFFHPNRLGKMRYAVIDTLDGGGQANGAAYAGGLSPATFTHEFGHTLGLTHAGHSQWGTQGMNCLPHYDSLMNYAFSGPLRFTNLGDTTVINPSSVNEWSPFTPAIPVAHLADVPWFLTVMSGGVDFDRRGAPTTGAVRAMTNAARNRNCESMSMGRESIANNVVAQGSPDILRVGNRLHAFYVRDDDDAYYAHAALGSALEHGCTGDDDPTTTATPCHSWSAATSLGLDEPAQSLSALWNGSEVFVAYHTRDDSIRVARYTTSSNGTLTKVSDAQIVADAHGVAPTLAHVEAPIGFGWGAGMHVVMFTNDGVRVNWHRYTRIGWASIGLVQSATGGGISSGRPVAAVTWPGPFATTSRFRTTCFAEANSLTTVLWCLDPATQRWRGNSLSVDRTGGSCGSAMTNSSPCRPDIEGTLDLSFRIARRANGTPIASDGSDGHLVLTYRDPDENAGYFVVSERISSVQPIDRSDLRLSNWRDYTRHRWTKMTMGTVPAMYDDVQLGSMVGLESVRRDNADRIDALPFASGSFDANLTVSSDFMVMEDHICRVLVKDAMPNSGDAICGVADVFAN